jgi:plasmid maintenance system antidote protein VapI
MRTKTSAYLSQIMADQGVTQAQVARAAKCSQQTINNICCGHKPISVDLAVLLEFALPQFDAGAALTLQLMDKVQVLTAV